MSLFSAAKKVEKKYENLLHTITGEYNATSYNILNPNFLTYHFMNRYVGEFSVFAKGILLDIGCGIKPYYRLFSVEDRSASGGKDRVNGYYGLDYPESITTEESRVSPSSRDPEYSGLGTSINRYNKPDIWGNGMHLPIKAKAVDSVVSFMVLEHISEPELFIQEVRRVIKPEGTVILSTVQAYPIHHEKYDFFRYTRLGLHYLFEKYGFEIVVLKPHGHFFVHSGEMINHYVNRRLFRNVKWNSLKIVLGMVKVLLTPVLLLFTMIVNSISLILNYIDIDETFTTGYTVLAKLKNGTQ